MPAASNGRMNNGLEGATSKNTESYNRSRLLPSNRRLRHLHGLSLRHLGPLIAPTKRGDHEDGGVSSVSARQSLARNVPSDNDTISKSESLKQASLPELHRIVTDKHNTTSTASEYARERPSLEISRKRRSTLIWAGKSPEARQRKLEAVISSSVADTWFSLHCGVFEEPVYVSEVVPESMNPNYRFFDLETAGPAVTRLDNLEIKIWAKTKDMSDYELVLRQHLNLPSLLYMGKSLEDLDFQLPPNSLMVYLSDGIYTVPKSNIPNGFPEPRRRQDLSRPLVDEPKPTSSYDALMRLSSLDDCIQDALQTREKLALRINAVLQKYKGHMNANGHVSERKGALSSVRRYVAAERRELRAARTSHGELVQSLQARREAMLQGEAVHHRTRDYVENAAAKLQACETLARRCSEEIRAQRRRICEDLAQIYPIEPMPRQPSEFSICRLPLSHATLLQSDEDSTAAALGYVAQMTQSLSHYLSIPLSYPVTPHLSTSRIRDPISLLQGSRTFPLHPTNTVQYRFEYGVFLLNKDIESLLSRQGAKVLDLRHTLPNLKYLLYTITHGDDGLPTRRAGRTNKGSLIESPASQTPSIQSPGEAEDAAAGVEGDDGMVVKSDGNV